MTVNPSAFRGIPGMLASDLAPGLLKVVRRQLDAHAVISFDASDEYGDQVFIPIINPNEADRDTVLALFAPFRTQIVKDETMPALAEGFAHSLEIIQSSQACMAAAYTALR